MSNDRTVKGLLLEARLGEYEMQVLAQETIINMFDDLKAQNLKLVEAIKFYADDGNWDCDRKAYHDHIIDETDMKPNKDGIGKVGGKLARSVLKELGIEG